VSLKKSSGIYFLKYLVKMAPTRGREGGREGDA